MAEADALAMADAASVSMTRPRTSVRTMDYSKRLQQDQPQNPKRVHQLAV